jgi:hypothetical protein
MIKYKHKNHNLTELTMAKDKCKLDCGKCGPGGAFYFLGLIGAAVYFISSATGFWVGVVGFLKALVWPAFLVYQLLESLAM